MGTTDTGTAAGSGAEGRTSTGGSGGFDVAIRGGLVVTGGGRRRADVYLRDGVIGAVLAPTAPKPADRVVDADGLWVLPGFVDTHVHLMEPGDESREDFPSGTAAAARSGVTTIIEHTHGWPVTDVDRLEEKRRHLAGRSHVDFALAAHVWDDNLDAIAPLWRHGVAFFKVFTCATHGVPATTSERMLEVFELVASIDATCLVHAEDDLITAANERRLREAGRFDGALLSEWRSRTAEEVATGTTSLLARATGAEITLAHVSNEAVIELARRERRAGARLTIETCPQYLTLLEHELVEHGALRKFTPPARARSEAELLRMWEAFDRGEIDLLSSDHAPSTLDQKREGDLWEVHFGLPGLDTTSSVALDAALRGLTSIERVVEAYSEVPARRYRLRGKGRLRPGADADLVLVDPEAQRRLRSDDVWSKAGWTPYDGREVRGAPVSTWLRGREVVADGELVDDDRRGHFLTGPGNAS